MVQKLKSVLFFRTPFLLAIESFALYFWVRLDPDPYHDGFIYAQAIAVKDGLFPNRDFFAQYGPIAPLIHGSWLRINSSSLLDLRLLNGMLIIGIGYLLQRNITSKFGFRVGFLINAVWVFTLASHMPWPSIISTFLTLLSFTILVENAKKLTDTDGKPNHSYLFSISFLLWLAILTRIQLILIIVGITLVFILWGRYLNQRVLRYWLVAQFTMLTSIFSFLYFSGSISEYMIQTIRWSSAAYSSVDINRSFITSLLLFPLGLLFGIQLVKIGNKILTVRWGYYFYCLLLFLIVGSLQFFSHLERTGNQSLTNPRIFLIDSSNILLNFLLYGSVTLICIIAFLRIFPKSKVVSKDSKSDAIVLDILIITSVFSLLQLYPLHDFIHVWFVAPIFILTAAFGLTNLLGSKNGLVKLFTPILSVTLFFQILNFQIVLNQPREYFQSKELEGMLGSHMQVNSLDRIMLALDNLQPKGRLRNECIQGLFAISDNTYNQFDGNFVLNSRPEYVDWFPNVRPSVIPPKYIFRCGVDAKEIENYRLDGVRILLISPESGEQVESRQTFSILVQDLQNQRTRP